MANSRKKSITVQDFDYHPESKDRCWICGQTRNLPATRYDGMCMSCYMDFNEDDIALELFGIEAMPV